MEVGLKRLKGDFIKAPHAPQALLRSKRSKEMSPHVPQAALRCLASALRGKVATKARRPNPQSQCEHHKLSVLFMEHDPPTTGRVRSHVLRAIHWVRSSITRP
jgi:hypothetical protein